MNVQFLVLEQAMSAPDAVMFCTHVDRNDPIPFWRCKSARVATLVRQSN
jgi:hypothetical protein